MRYTQHEREREINKIVQYIWVPFNIAFLSSVVVLKSFT